MKSKLEIYALAVCFVAVFCIVISAAIASYAVINITLPNITMDPYIYDKYQTNDAFWKDARQYINEGEREARPDEGILTKKRQAAFTVALSNEKRSGLQALLRAVVFLVSGSVALIIHWLIAKNIRGSSTYTKEFDLLN